MTGFTGFYRFSATGLGVYLFVVFTAHFMILPWFDSFLLGLARFYRVFLGF